ncbi:MAG TPA: metallophosphoesterase [Humisphaera sp.]
MPITLPPISRRRFLASSLAAAAGGVLGRRAWADGGAGRRVDPNRFALISDTHVAADPKAANKGVTMFDTLTKVRADVLAFGETRPAFALVNGDLAFNEGKPADYRTFLDAVRPLQEAGMPVHLGLGNHDHRENFWAAVPAVGNVARPVENRHVTVVESPLADWVMLDSLEATNKTPGLLGAAQLAWLAKVLDERPGKSCVVVVHHNPQPMPATRPAAPPPAATRPQTRPAVTGLRDTAELLALLRPRRQAKALVFGHSHRWERAEVDGLHLVNLPTTAYPFKPNMVTGWVDCVLSPGGARLTVRAVDAKHPQHNEVAELAWRG